MSGQNTLGQDEKISASKIEPLASDAKKGVERDDAGGVTGTDAKIDRARIGPVGGAGVGQNPAPASDSQGSVGTDATIAESKIHPLEGSFAAEKGSRGKDGTRKGDAAGNDTSGLHDEEIDQTRIAPMGSVREDVKP